MEKKRYPRRREVEHPQKKVTHSFLANLIQNRLTGFFLIIIALKNASPL
jgi:hypothetical protein